MTGKELIVLYDGAPGYVEATKQAFAGACRKGSKVIGICFEEGTFKKADNFLYV